MIDLLPTPWHWANACAIAVVVGAAKSGLPGLGFLAVPWLAWVLAPHALLSVGGLLPLLIVADVLAVWLYRRNPAVGSLWPLLPWVACGMFGGAALILALPPRGFGAVIGGAVLAMILVHLWRRRHPGTGPPGRATGAGIGVIAGVVTTVANAAGPVMNLYLLACRLPKEEFLAAGAWFFLAVNLAKLPLYLGLGALTGGGTLLITPATLLMDLCLVPAVVVGALLGRILVRRIPQRVFEGVVLALAAAGAIGLMAT